MAINKTVNKSTKSHGAMRNVLEYVLRDSKTKEHLVTVTGPYDRSVIDYDNVYQTFLEEKRLWNKDSGRMYAHNVISFHKDEEITLEEAFDFGKEFAQKWFADFQTVVAVHQDKEHKHIHLVTNSVSFVDGHKLHATKKDLDRMKELTNEMCKERGFTIAQKGKHFDGTPFDVGEVVAWSQDKYKLLANEVKESFLASCGLAVLNALESCTDKLQFIERMLEQGWETIWKDTKKHITFINEDGKRVRGSNLAKTFQIDATKEGLEHEFERQKERADADELERYYGKLESIAAGEILREFEVTDSTTRRDHANSDHELGKLEAQSEIARENRERSVLRKEDSQSRRADRDDERERLIMEARERAREEERRRVEAAMLAEERARAEEIAAKERAREEAERARRERSRSRGRGR